MDRGEVEMKESNVKQLIRLEASKNGWVLWNNSRGIAYMKDGSTFKYGLGPNGASDLIGYVPITVTQEMVGKQMAVFCAVEVKRKGGRVRSEQKQFIDSVISHGGVALSCDDPEELLPLAQGVATYLR